MKSDIIFEKNLETNQLNVSINTERLIMKSTISSHLSDYKKLLMNPENMLKVMDGNPWSEATSSFFRYKNHRVKISSARICSTQSELVKNRYFCVVLTVQGRFVYTLILMLAICELNNFYYLFFY
ncbi:MAG TPA: hypothetical protein VGH95_07630 [Candidatus Aquirickettsiella sp.]